MTAARIRHVLRQLGWRSRGMLACLSACIAVAGCATTGTHPDAMTAAAEPGRAVVIGWGNTAGENAREALTVEPGSRVTRLFVGWVNDRKISFGDNIVRLPPGEYDLVISCGIYVYYRFFTHDKLLRAHLDANRVYRLRSDLEGRRCEPYLEDVTGAGR